MKQWDYALGVDTNVPKKVFANVNARSIRSKPDDVESLLLAIKPDFLAITETWLTHDIMDFEITPPTYAILRKDSATQGGGMAILINKKKFPSLLCLKHVM